MIGKQLGNYVITDKIGEGGMGAVYLAHHPLIGRQVAIKILRPEIAANQEAVSRFFTEARTANEIRHPNIVEITDFGQTEDGFYLVMELLEGETLDDRIKREGVLDEKLAANIIGQVAGALGAAHERGVVHRDLKPENIYLTKNPDAPFVKVLDFGIAKLVGNALEVSHKTVTGSLIGTPYYMSPEQCAGEASLDLRSDIYSLGVVLYEMLTGSLPFTGESIGKLILQHNTSVLPSPRVHNPKISTGMEGILFKMMEKAPQERYQSMQELRIDLGRVQANPSYARTVSSSPLHAQSVVPGLKSTTLGASAQAFDSPTQKVGRRTLLTGLGFTALALAVAFFAARAGSSDAPDGRESRSSANNLAGHEQAVDAAPMPSALAAEPDASLVAPSTIVHIVADPPAMATHGEVDLGETPVEISVSDDAPTQRVVLRRPGYEDLEVDVSAEQAPTMQVDLQKIAKQTKPIKKPARQTRKKPDKKMDSNFRVSPVKDPGDDFVVKPVE